MVDNLKVIVGRILFSSIIPVITIFYVLLNHYKPGIHTIQTSIDQAIPFCKYFALPYLFMFPYILICLLYFAVKDYKIYFQLLGSDVLGMFICYAVFYIFPTVVARPVVSGNDIFSMMMHYIYSENPYNCFPSIHVFSALLPLLFSFRYGKSSFMKAFTFTGGILISISTLFVKQHYILDAAAALVLAVIMYLIFTNAYIWSIAPIKKVVNLLIPSSLKRPFVSKPTDETTCETM